MCGHAGLIIVNPNDFVSKPKYKLFGAVSSNNAADIASALLSENQFYRGGDGFGLMALSSVSLSDPTIGNNYRVSFVKKVDDFTHKWNSVVDSERVFTSTGVVCMHARKMTAGSKVYASTHPIHVGNITLMHNGSIPNWQSIFPNCGSDTIGIAKMLAEDGIQRVAETIDGAKTLVWLDSSDNSLNFFKHSERPLYMYMTGSSYVYASEEWMVFKALDQYGLPRDGQVVFEDGYHYKYMVLEKRWVSPVKYKDPEPYTYHSKKKVGGMVVMGAASHGTRQNGKDAENIVQITAKATAHSKRKVMTTREPFAMQPTKVIQYTDNTICIKGSIALSSYEVPLHFLMKDVKMFLPNSYKNVAELLVRSGMYIATCPIRTTNSMADFVVADGIKGLVFCFDPTYTDKEFDNIDEAAVQLHRLLTQANTPLEVTDNIRDFCELLDGFSENRTNPLGLALTPHKERFGLLQAVNLTRIPQV